jgi:DNA polymerase
MLDLDLETRSDVDLIFHGLRRYVEDLSTEVICMAYAFDDGPIEFWWGSNLTFEPGAVPPNNTYTEFPAVIIEHIKNGGLITAHNASFEKHIFDHVISRLYGVTPPTNEQWRCSMAMGLTNGFAGGLDALAAGLGLPYRKHAQGARLIREYCAPGHLKTFKPGDADLMKDYNISDVEIMRAAVKCLRPLTDEEWEEYHINAIVNDRGLPIDTAFCDAALGYTREIQDDANEQISVLTGGAMAKATERKSRDAWLFPKLTPHQMKLLEVYKKGEKKISLDQDHRRYLLECEDLDYEARRLLEYIDNAGSSALKKFTVASHQHHNGRVHNTFLFNGAGRTGRFSGKGLQPHNIRRDVFDHNQAEALIQDVLAGFKIDQPANTMARLLRAMIYHDTGLYWSDWSSIEGRTAPWLSNSEAGDAKLELFKQGRDVYVVTAASMSNVQEKDVDKDFRQTGKIAELSLQFGGSHNALIGMAKNYGTTFEEHIARDIVDKWRFTNPWAGQIWAEYDQAITEAVLNPGTSQNVGRVVYHCDGDNYLWCQLPSERLLSYPKPKFETYMTPWGEERIGVTFQSHFKPAAGEPPIRIHARGALLFQNTVQAVAADCLREAVVEAHDAGLEIVGHVHDEIIGLGSREDGERLNDIMLEQPWWADGLPLNTGGVSWGKRYGK